MRQYSKRSFAPLLFLVTAFVMAGAVIAPALTNPALAQAYRNDQVASQAKRFETYLRSSWNIRGDNASGFRDQGRAALQRGDARSATGLFASSVVLEPDSASTWLALGRAYLAIEPSDYSERSNFSRNATSAAYIAYERATSAPDRAAALALTAQGLAAQSLWRPALDAYKASLATEEVQWVRAAHDQLRAEQGFRMLDYSVDSEAGSPRLCIQFSERLARGVDFADFISINGADPAGVTAEDRQLCVEELLHGQRYQVRLRQGLPSAVDEALIQPVDLTVYVRDRSPTARFSGRNYVLPRTGQIGLPLTSINAEQLALEIYRIGDRRLAHEVLEGSFAQQISGYRAQQIKDEQGELLWQGTMSVDMVLNEEVTTTFPINEVKADLKPGLYIMTAKPAGSQSDDWSDRATQWFVVSDLGLMAMTGEDGVHVFARSLETAQAIEGLEIRLVARNNEVLQTATTDDSGRVVFGPGLARGTGGLAPALVIARTPEGDYGFLDLTSSAFDLSDRGVAGRAAPGPLDAFVVAERGVYRPGEEVHLTALLRDGEAKAVAGVPLTLMIRRPDGVEHARIVIADEGAGGRTYTMRLLDSAMAGTWRITAHIDPQAPAIGDTAFLVEDYVPERLEMNVRAGDAPLSAASPAEIAVSGRYLFGAPASDLALEGEMTLRPQRELSARPGYVFGLAGEDVPSVREPLSDLPRTGADGEARIQIALPSLPETSRPLSADVTLRLVEPGGRAISRNVSLRVDAADPVIGIKQLFSGLYVPEGEPARFEVVAVDGTGKGARVEGARWEIVRVQTRYQWYSSYGNWAYEPVTYTEKVADGTIEALSGEPTLIEAPVGYGRYRLEITGAAPDGPSASAEFSGGWFVSDQPDNPDILEIALDRGSYQPGDTMQVRISPRAAGTALVSVVSDKVLATRTVDVPEAGATVSFTVREDWGPGAYVSAMLYTPMSEQARRMPSRALGVAWVPLDQAPNTLAISLNAPEGARPGRTLSLPVRVDGLRPGETARLTIAAVDLGILNLTGYQPPRPEAHYLGQRRLGTEIRDLYGRLIDGMTGTRGQIRTGGDLMPGGLEMSGSPRDVKPVAMFSGMLVVGEDGTVEASFDIPAFDGTLRIMAVGWSASQVGHAVADVIVRDPVVVLGTAPHFLTIGDRSELHLRLENVEGPGGEYQLRASVNGGIAMSDDEAMRDVTLEPGASTSISLPISAQALGAGEIRVSLSGPDDLALERNFAVPVKPAAPSITRRSLQTLAAKSGTLSVTRDLIADLIPETARVAVHVGRDAAMDVPGLLLSLDRYPYGCAEQVTSRALPLLYLNEVAEAAGLAGEDGARARVMAAIERLASLQDSSGNFGLWSAGSYDTWLTAYVTDFLVRATEQGYEVRAEVLGPALDRLRNAVSYAADFTSGGEELAYALYVLARAGRAVIGDLRYYADTKLANFATPLAQAQLGAALALYGDRERAASAFSAALARLQSSPQQVPHRVDFGSGLRDSAGLLSLAAETRMMSAQLPSLIDVVQQWRGEKTGTTTQENAWLLLAARALGDADSQLELEVAGTRQSGPVQRVLTGAGLAEQPFTLRNVSERSAPVSILVSGASATPEPASSSGFTITRQVFTPDGKEASLETVRQNERYVVVLSVTEDEARPGHVIVEDRLPAGFQIENPRLLGASDLAAFAWLKTDLEPAHTAFRDDSFIGAFTFSVPNRERPATLRMAYMMRAVAPGTYVQGGARVEDMYRPERFARTNPGMVEIVRPER